MIRSKTLAALSYDDTERNGSEGYYDEHIELHDYYSV